MSTHYPRIQLKTSTTGTGPLFIEGVIPGYRAIGTVYNDNSTFHYRVEHLTANEWEEGTGTYDDPGRRIERTTVLASSNSDNEVNFSAGEKRIIIDGRVILPTYASDPDGTLEGEIVNIAGTIKVSDGSSLASVGGGSGPTVYTVTKTNADNTAAEIDIISITIPAGAWADGELIELHWAVEGLNSGGTTTMTTKLYYGSDSLTFVNGASVGSGGGYADYAMRLWRQDDAIRILGHNGTVLAAAPYPFHSTEVSQFRTDNTVVTKGGGDLTSISFATEKVLRITFQWGAADATRYYKIIGARAVKW